MLLNNMVKINRQKGIVLVLGGGGVKGLAHIGVLEILHEHKIPIKRVIGTSAGALVGGIFCAGKLKELKKLALKVDKKFIFRIFFSFPSSIAIFNTSKIDNLIKKYTEGVKIEDLKIPFTSIAFNITEGKKVIFSKGELFDAIRASMSMPFFFKPFKIGTSLFIDGSITDIVPVDLAKRYAGKNKVIAVNLETRNNLTKNPLNLFRILEYASYLGMIELARFQEKNADLVIKPYASAGYFDYYHAHELIEEGRKAARKAIPKIRKMINSK